MQMSGEVTTERDFFGMDLGHFPKITKNRLKKGTNYSINSVISAM